MEPTDSTGSTDVVGSTRGNHLYRDFTRFTDSVCNHNVAWWHFLSLHGKFLYVWDMCSFADNVHYMGNWQLFTQLSEFHRIFWEKSHQVYKSLVLFSVFAECYPRWGSMQVGGMAMEI